MPVAFNFVLAFLTHVLCECGAVPWHTHAEQPAGVSLSSPPVGPGSTSVVKLGRKSLSHTARQASPLLCWSRELADKSDYLSRIPGTYVMEGENHLRQVVL